MFTVFSKVSLKLNARDISVANTLPCGIQQPVFQLTPRQERIPSFLLI